MYSIYHNPDLDDWIFDCLLASMAAVLAEDVCASFLFVGDLNGHHQEWLGSTTTNSHGVAAFDIATVSGCDQLVVGPTLVFGGTLDLLMTDVPDLVRVAVVARIGNSDHSSLSAVISMARAVPNLCVSWKVFLKHQVNWNTVCGAIRELPWRNIWLSDNPVEVLNKHLSLIKDKQLKIPNQPRSSNQPTKDDQPRSSVCVTRINLSLIIDASMLLASSKRLIFGGPVIALELTGKSLSAVK